MGNLIPINQTLRNPASNWQVNPARNWQINPARNWQINPARNWQINPARNWQINPAHNWQINPARNWQVNPTRNWLINPILNWQINPVQNWQVNPYQNRLFLGLFVNRVNDSSVFYFTVNTRRNGVILFFDADLRFSFFAVLAQSTITCAPVYSAESHDYVGFLCPNSAGGFNWFDLNGEWLYFTS